VTALDRRVEELAAEQLGVFSTRQVFLLGQGTPAAIRARVTSGRWVRGDHAVLRLLGTPDGLRTRLMSFVVASDFRAVVSHRSAAGLHGLPGFEHAPPEFTLPRGVDVGRRAGVRLHRTNLLPTHHRTLIGPIPTTSIARTLLDLTAVVPVGRAARAMDTALARQRTTYWQLLQLLAEVAVRGRRRTRIFRMLLRERGPHHRPPASELEKQFDLLAQRLAFAGWDRQVDVGDQQAWIGRVDFLHRRARVVLEVDGREAHSSFLDSLADAERDRRLAAAGFEVCRIGWAEVVHDGAATARRLRSIVSARV
jgi:very-short-patch-repair endonuclease